MLDFGLVKHLFEPTTGGVDLDGVPTEAEYLFAGSYGWITGARATMF